MELWRILVFGRKAETAPLAAGAGRKALVSAGIRGGIVSVVVMVRDLAVARLM